MNVPIALPAPSRIRKWSLALSLMTLMATQSRALLGGAAGIGELSALVFLFSSVLERTPAQARGVPGFTRVAAIIMWLGFFVGAFVNLWTRWSPQLAWLDLLVVPFSISYAACAIQYFQLVARPRQELATLLTWAILVQALPLLLLPFGIVAPAWLTDSDTPGVPFVSRYMGWSENPNQLGLLLCAYPIIALGALAKANGRKANWFYVFGMLVSLVMAGVVRSSTVFADYLVCASIWSILKLNRWDVPGRRGLRPARIAITFAFLAVSVTAFGFLAHESINKTGDSDANGRFERWESAFKGIEQSHWLGVGPGGQSGETKPFQGEEAHNLLLDLTLQGGAISLVSYLILAASCLVRAIALRSMLALCVVIAVLTQQQAHYTARQPVFWVLLMLPFALSPRRGAGASPPSPTTTWLPPLVAQR